MNTIKKITEGMSGQEVADLLYENFKMLDKQDQETINELILEFSKKFLRKDIADAALEPITFKKGAEFGTFSEGVLGTGGKVSVDENNNTHAEFDFLTIRKKAFFTEITVQELKHIGGQLILSPAAMVCSKVVEKAEGYQCYFNTNEGGRSITNDFAVGDGARCQTFNLNVNRYYWRKVIGLGNDYIVLSKVEADANSDVPAEGDNIVQFGNEKDVTRQNATILSAYGTDAPSFKQYKGITLFKMPDKPMTKFAADGNEVSGILHVEHGSTGAGNLDDLPEEVRKAAQIGAVNLLRNAGFTGNYESEKVVSSSELNGDTELYSASLRGWTGMADVADDATAISGKSATIGSLSQSVDLIQNEHYVISFFAKGTTVAVTCGDYSATKSLTAEYQRFEIPFTHSGGNTFLISGTATIRDLQLERGTIATDWKRSPLDNDKSFDEFKALRYITDSIKNGSVDILGGLILANMIMLGNYRDGVMQKVTAGVNGAYSDGKDVAFWAGGSLEDAIRTVSTFSSNPNAYAQNLDWTKLANFVATHGGDVFLKGYIYALGGMFKGAVDIASGKIKLNADGSGSLANGGIHWDRFGKLYRKQDYVTEFWNPQALKVYKIDLALGCYIEGVGLASDPLDVQLPVPNAEMAGRTIYVHSHATTRLGAAYRFKPAAAAQLQWYNATLQQYIDVSYVSVPMQEDRLVSITCDGNCWYAEREFLSSNIRDDDAIATYGQDAFYIKDPSGNIVDIRMQPLFGSGHRLKIYTNCMPVGANSVTEGEFYLDGDVVKYKAPKK